MTVLLDINDATLGLWRGGECILRSPGYALLEGKTYQFGQEARDQARLQPQKINHRYWSQLNVEPLTPAFGPGRHSADLVHAHLLQIHKQGGEPEQVVITAPSSLQHEQLALLLGIVEACPFEAAGLVDRGVLALAGAVIGDEGWHVELQLHQALVTGAQRQGGELSRHSAVPIPGSGWLAFQDSLARAIADAFIRQTRFDPRRQAASEQALYNQLPNLLKTLASSAEHNMELGGHRARVERSLLAEACENHYERIRRAVEGAGDEIFLGSSLALLPEIGQRLPNSQPLGEDVIHSALEANLDLIGGGDEGLHFITHLPASQQLTRKAVEPPAVEASAPEPEPAPEPAPEPEPIDPINCRIDVNDGIFTLVPGPGEPPSVNGAPATGPTRLSGGDLIELDRGRRWRLVDASAEDTGSNGPQET